MGKKTQPVGGSFKFQQKSSRNITKTLFFSGVTLFEPFFRIFPFFSHRERDKIRKEKKGFLVVFALFSLNLKGNY